MVLTYFRNLPNMRRILMKRLSLLHNSERCKYTFNLPAMVTYRKRKNIQNMPTNEGNPLTLVKKERTVSGKR